jgi:hypothetical protein
MALTAETSQISLTPIRYLVSPLQIRELFDDVPPGWRRLEEERGRGGKDSAMVDAGTSRVLMGGFGNRPSDLEGYVAAGIRV